MGLFGLMYIKRINKFIFLVKLEIKLSFILVICIYSSFSFVFSEYKLLSYLEYKLGIICLIYVFEIHGILLCLVYIVFYGFGEIYLVWWFLYGF